MKRYFRSLCLGLLCFQVTFAQNDSVVTATTAPQRSVPLASGPVVMTNFRPTVYRIKPAVDVPLTVAGVGWSLFAFTKIYNKDSSTAAQIMALNQANISSINRWAVDRYSEKAFKASNVFFYGAMPLPLVLLLDKNIRRDAGKIGLLYFEAMGITGLLYTGSVFLHDKYRPYAYNPSVPMSRRTRGGAKNSFFAGHVALVGTSTFFVAKVYADYHPESKIKWVLYSMAGAATAATGYLRHRAGEHFPTDVAIGMAVGTLSGILVPQLHKNLLIKNPRLSISPVMGPTTGLYAAYRL